MACEGCAEDRCKRRDVTFVPHHAMLCSTRKSYAKILDEVHGVKNEEVIPDSYDPEKDQDAAVYRQRRVVRRKKKGCFGKKRQRVELWLGRKCNCKERRNKLNDLSRWARSVINSDGNHEQDLNRIVGQEPKKWVKKVKQQK